MLDAALLRPGRLDRLLYCGFPAAPERLQVRGPGGHAAKWVSWRDWDSLPLLKMQVRQN